MWTILLDKTNDNGDYLAKPIIEKHTDLFNQLNSPFNESVDEDDYALYKNKPDMAKKVMEKVGETFIAPTSDGMETPTSFLVDIDSYENGEYGLNGITQVFFNYIDFIEGDSYNSANKGEILRDMWNYQNIFDKDYQYGD